MAFCKAHNRGVEKEHLIEGGGNLQQVSHMFKAGGRPVESDIFPHDLEIPWLCKVMLIMVDALRRKIF